MNFIFGLLKPLLTVDLAERLLGGLLDAIVGSKKNPLKKDLVEKVITAFREAVEAYEAGKEVYDDIKEELK